MSCYDFVHHGALLTELRFGESSLLGFVWAYAPSSLGLIATMTKNLITIRKATIEKPFVHLASTNEFEVFSVLAAMPVDVIH